MSEQQTRSYGRPSPTDWTTKPITPARAEEVRRKAVDERMKSDLRELKEHFFNCLTACPSRHVIMNSTRALNEIPTLSQSRDAFVAELRLQGFEVKYCDDLCRSSYGEIDIRW
jgi:hypothetical protein